MNRLLFTGSTGFLGKNIVPILKKAGYDIVTLNRLNSIINCDLSREVPSIKDPFDVVIHAAGKAHYVPKTNDQRKLFFDINYQGTKNLCTAFEQTGLPKSFIFISTVAVYGCDFGENISENHPLNGVTPYALSKIKAEQYLTKWCEKHNVILSIIRPSLIAGPNPPGNLGSMINGIKSGKYLSISGRKSRKSVLMVQDIANLIPLLVVKGGVYNVCDSKHPSFRDLERIISLQLGQKNLFSIPYFFAKILAIFGDLVPFIFPINSDKLNKITMSLTFSNEKARNELAFEPIDVLNNFKIF